MCVVVVDFIDSFWTLLLIYLLKEPSGNPPTHPAFFPICFKPGSAPTGSPNSGYHVSVLFPLVSVFALVLHGAVGHGGAGHQHQGAAARRAVETTLRTPVGKVVAQVSGFKEILL